MKKWLRRIAIGLVVTNLGLAFLVWLVFIHPFWGWPFEGSRHTRVPITPPWAFECWLWEDDVNTADAVLELLSGYEAHDFPVRTVLIDSPWSTRYNDFIVDEDRYPNPSLFFGDLQDRGYRVVLWITPMVNSSSEDTKIQDSADWFKDASARGFVAGGDYQWKWWKGKGGFIDYTNPDAVKWWRGLQQQVFDWGIDGWKLDDTATMFSSRVGKVPLPFQRTYAGLMTTRSYMDHYYRDEYEHGLSQNPEFITLARSIDGFRTHPEGFAPLDASPVNWVGDQDHEWDLEKEGIQEAIGYILKSAELGYNVVGSDVAGYSGGTIPPNLYIRWAQFSTFCGLFLNGGHGERAMWKRSTEELKIIRRFAWLHTELIPYMYSHTVRCHNGGKPLMQPVKGKYQYLFGADLLVAPIFEDSPTRTIEIPKGRWRMLLDDSQVIDGPTTITRDFTLAEFPVFVREGAILPMIVKRDYTGFGTKSSDGFVTYAIYPGAESMFTTVHPDGNGETTLRVASSDAISITISGSLRPLILRIHMERKPRTVSFDGRDLVEEVGWKFDGAARKLVITSKDGAAGDYNIVP